MNQALHDWTFDSEASMADVFRKLNEAHCDAQDIIHRAMDRTFEIRFRRVGLEYPRHYKLARRLGLLWSQSIPYVRCLFRLNGVGHCEMEWRDSVTAAPQRLFCGCDHDRDTWVLKFTGLTVRLMLDAPPSGFLTDLEILVRHRANWRMRVGLRPPASWKEQAQTK
jgi:hypothetical protein